MCESFAEQGNEVELIVPKRKNFIKESVFDYYGIRKNFKIKKIPTIDLIFLGKIGFLIQSFLFSIFLLLYLFFRKKKNIIYVRGEIILPISFFFKENIFWETHIKPNNIKIYKKVFNKIKGIIIITKYYEKEIKEELKISSKKIFYYPDGVDLKKFNIKISKEKAREKLNLPLDKKIVLYVGHLYDWKGVQVLAEASEYLNENTEVFFVGGTEKDIKDFKEKNKKFKNVLIVGHKSRSEVVYWQKSADVLILPNSAKSKVSMYYTSPMKLFEYMAAKRPIVASDLPSIRDILNKENSVLVEADNPEELAEGINEILRNRVLDDKISEQAFRDVKNYTWEKRARNISDFIFRINKNSQ
jgi:glycosyltransferase involved in cell wall biosynthesis